jgi:hypothetical protein
MKQILEDLMFSKLILSLQGKASVKQNSRKG